MLASASPFDALAEDYDRAFTASAIGRRMRAAVWRRLDATFGPGDRVLELNCGTGEDALHLAGRGVFVHATDNSEQMLRIARAKLARAGLDGRVATTRLAIEDIGQLRNEAPFDGVLSNFGGFNCVADLPAVAADLAGMVRPGGRVIACLMGPLVPWEWGWYLARLRPRTAFRRLRGAGTDWRGLTIRYPSPGRLARAFAPHFVERRRSAIGALVPPTYAEPWAARHPQLLALLDRCERRFETLTPLPLLADHYLLELERCGVADEPIAAAAALPS